MWRDHLYKPLDDKRSALRDKAAVPSEPSMEVEVEVVPPCQTEYPPTLKYVGSAAYQSSCIVYWSAATAVAICSRHVDPCLFDLMYVLIYSQI